MPGWRAAIAPGGRAPTALVVASVLNLATFHELVRAPDPEARLVYPTFVLALVAIADAWAAGVLIEARRLALARAIAGVTLAEAPVAYLLTVSGMPVPAAEWTFIVPLVLAASCGAAALAFLKGGLPAASAPTAGRA